MSHIVTEEQKKAIASVKRAIAKCRKAGLAIYAKQWNLVFYTNEADRYADTYAPLHKPNWGGVIPYESIKDALNDSGADDYAQYATEEDSEKYNPDNL